VGGLKGGGRLLEKRTNFLKIFLGPQGEGHEPLTEEKKEKGGEPPTRKKKKENNFNKRRGWVSSVPKGTGLHVERGPI